MNDVNFTQSITRIINNAVNNAADNDTIVTLLSLSCLYSIINRNQNEGSVQNTVSNPSAASATNQLQRVLSELTKGDDSGPSPDLLMSLLPLLNSPQVKSKINPNNIAALFSMLNGFGGEKHDKSNKNTNKIQSINDHKETKEEIDTPPAVTEVEKEPDVIEPDFRESEKKTSSHLNWKSNF
jgi:hypothetical protein